VGACVGIRGGRIRNIVDELGGEKIDIVRFNESSQVFIANALRPAEVEDIFLNHELGRATVIVPEAQLSLAIGKRGQNVRLAARLTGWDLDIMMAEEFQQQRNNAIRILSEVPGVSPELAQRIAGAGFVSFGDIAQLDVESLTCFDGVDDELARAIIAFAAEYTRQMQAADQAKAEASAAGTETGKESPASDAKTESRVSDETTDEATAADESPTGKSESGDSQEQPEE